MTLTPVRVFVTTIVKIYISFVLKFLNILEVSRLHLAKILMIHHSCYIATMLQCYMYLETRSEYLVTSLLCMIRSSHLRGEELPIWNRLTWRFGDVDRNVNCSQHLVQTPLQHVNTQKLEMFSIFIQHSAHALINNYK